IPKNSRVPVRYATGDPSSRRSIRSDKAARSSSAIGSGYRMNSVARFTPRTCRSNTSASSRAVSIPAAERRAAPSRIASWYDIGRPVIAAPNLIAGEEAQCLLPLSLNRLCLESGRRLVRQPGVGQPFGFVSRAQVLDQVVDLAVQ